MEPKNLLAPRYKVLIDYPNSLFVVGDILVYSEKLPPNAVGKYINESTGWVFVHNPLNFPHIFLELKWYSARTKEDMPTYIKTNPEWIPKYKKDKPFVGQVLKPFEIIPMDHLSHFFETEKAKEKDDMGNLTIYVPATEEEYNAYLIQKQSKS